MNLIPAEIVCQIFHHLTQDDLAQMRLVSHHYLGIVNRNFAEFPRYRNRALTIRSLDDNTVIALIERPHSTVVDGQLVRPAHRMIFDESSLQNLQKHIRPKFIQFDEVYFKAHNSKMYHAWSDLFVQFPHAFRQLSLFAVDFSTTPTIMEYTKVVTHLETSPRRIQFTFRNELPRLSHISMFKFSAFRHCQSVNVECMRMRRSLLGAISRRDYVAKLGADIIEFLHDNSQRSLNINPQFTPNEIYHLASNLQMHFSKANNPCQYTLQLRCYNGYNSRTLLNESTSEEFIVEEATELGSLLVKRQKLSTTKS